MSDPKKHHYIPQFILRNFADENGKVWWIRKGPPSVGPHQKKTSEVFAQNDLYSFIDESEKKDSSVESELSKVEDEIAPILKTLIGWDRVFPCPVSEEDFEKLNRFIVLIFKRNPGTLNEHVTFESVKKSFEDNICQYEQEGVDVATAFKTDILNPDYIKASVKEVQANSVMEISDEMVAVLKSRGVLLAYSDENDFVIGDNPILRRRGLNHEGLTDPTAKFWLPVAPNLAVTPFGTQGKLTVLLANSLCVTSFNEQSWLQSNAIVAKQKKSLLEFLKSTVDP